MRITSSKPTNKLVKIVVPVVIVAALIAAASCLYVYKFKGNILGWTAGKSTTSNTPTTNLDKPTNDQVKAGNDIKKGNVSNGSGGTDTQPAPLTQPSASKKSVEVIITAANQNNGSLQVRAQISTVTNTGQCTLSLTKAAKTVTKTVGVQALASTSTCKGFDIPVSELSPGSWQVSLTFDSDSLMGNTSKLITIQ